ncbi:MAG: family 43 glycosylhydrolase [Sphingobacteriales bacterium]|nr:family 43 glycosylhydrolase [Sphingobacteriales bacterium]OJY81057.1 MAG: hypothetical protein BGP14_07475 [Sphingobacteriales bacterium 44-15]
MKQFLITILFISLVIPVLAQKEIVINNIIPRVDTEGNIIDAHDGRIVKYGNRFYWYGTAYGNTSGYLRSNYFQCYSSPDLTTWKKEGKLLIDFPSGVYYRPHVIYNAVTRQYVLWYNWYPKLWEGRYGVAVADRPTGPFRIVNTDVKMKNSAYGVGDFGLFIDDDKAAYIAYNTIDGHKGSIEKLSADYLQSTLENGGFITEGCEAGAMFKRNGKYYLLTDYTCCFCTQGTGVRVYVSDSPTRGYELRNNINRIPGRPTSILVDGLLTPNVYETLKRRSDSSFDVIECNIPDEQKVNIFKIYQFTGNRSGVCGDTLAKKANDERAVIDIDLLVKKKEGWVKVHTRQSTEKNALYNIITISCETAVNGSISLKLSKNYPYNEIYLNEVLFFDQGVKINASQKGIAAYIRDGQSQNILPIIPAQQTFVMPLQTTKGVEYIWMGDIWGSSEDNIKGHDHQYWGAPLVFDADGDIQTMQWTDKWKVSLPD